jgi:hypothetical protein
VAASDSEKTLSKSDGKFSLSISKSDDQVALSQKEYAPSVHGIPKRGGSVQLFMKGLDGRVAFKAEDGVSVALSDGVKLDVPAHAVIDEKGAKVTGKVTLKVASVDGEKPLEAAALPGEGKAQTVAGKPGRFSAKHGLSISIEDATGKELNVSAQAKVMASVPGDAKPSTELDVYSYAPSQKAWTQEGVAKFDKDGTYHAQIKHLSWWGIGSFTTTTSCVRACVQSGSWAKIRRVSARSSPTTPAAERAIRPETSLPRSSPTPEIRPRTNWPCT